jgi:hypothetical protein
MIRYHTIPWKGTRPYHTIPWESIIPYHERVPYHTIPYHTMSGYHTIPWEGTILYHTMRGYHTIPYYEWVPYHTMRGYHTIPYHTMSGYHTIPWVGIIPWVDTIRNTWNDNRQKKVKCTLSIWCVYRTKLLKKITCLDKCIKISSDGLSELSYVAIKAFLESGPCFSREELLLAWLDLFQCKTTKTWKIPPRRQKIPNAPSCKRQKFWSI